MNAKKCRPGVGDFAQHIQSAVPVGCNGAEWAKLQPCQSQHNMARLIWAGSGARCLHGVSPVVLPEGV